MTFVKPPKRGRARGVDDAAGAISSGCSMPGIPGTSDQLFPKQASCEDQGSTGGVVVRGQLFINRCLGSQCLGSASLEEVGSRVEETFLQPWLFRHLFAERTYDSLGLSFVL